MKRTTHELTRGECVLDERAVTDVRELYNGLPALRTARNAFLSMALCAPFTVEIPALRVVGNDELEALIEAFWMPWLLNVYDWIKQLGICPYYLERVRGTPHYVPRTPPEGSGYITTHLDNSHVQRWRWFWAGELRGPKAARMYWIVGKNAPTVDGCLRSDIHSLLQSARTVQILRRALERAAPQAADPPYIMEYNPPRTQSGDDGLTTLEAFGEKIAGVVLSQEEGLKNKRLKLRTDALFEQLLSSYAANRRLAPAPQPISNTETPREAADRDDPRIAARSFPLRPYFKCTKGPTPAVLADLERYERRLDTQAASVMDFPLEMIQTANAGRAVNVEGNLQFLNDRIRETVAFFTSVIKRAFLAVYGPAIQDGLAEAARAQRTGGGVLPHQVLAHMAIAEVHVHMRCTPVVSVNQLRQLWQDGMMAKEQAAEQIFHKLLLPEELIEVTPDEEMVEIPQQKPPKKKERPQPARESRAMAN